MVARSQWYVLSCTVAVLAMWLGSAVLHGRAHGSALVDGVDAIAITVSDMDRAVDFYSRVLTFKTVSDVEVAGEDYERLEAVFGCGYVWSK